VMAIAAQRQADEVRAHQWEQEQLAQVEWRRQQQAEEDLGDQSAASELQQLLDLEQTMPSPPQHEQVPQPQSMMASPSPTPAQQLPECPVCMECYDHPPAEQAPVVLPCGHSICRQCALDLQTANPGRQRGSGTLAIVCPSCCQQLELPPGGAQALPCNYGLVQVWYGMVWYGGSCIPTGRWVMALFIEPWTGWVPLWPAAHHKPGLPNTTQWWASFGVRKRTVNAGGVRFSTER